MRPIAMGAFFGKKYMVEHADKWGKVIRGAGIRL
jgi:hypothetical protein